ncbi:MAG: septum formation family protein [Nocardioidaceae bacterium]
MRRILPGLVAALSFLLIPIGAADASRPAYAGKAGDPDYHRPVVGECRDYTLADVAPRSNSTPVVDCAQTHTAKVIAVGRLPKGSTWSDYTIAQQWRMTYRVCLPAYRSILGSNDALRDMSSFSTSWFIPTKAERDAGATWLRCDLILYAGTKLADLPYDTRPMLPAAPLPDTVARCRTKKFADTVCASGHTWRATGTFKLPDTTYPSEKRIRKAAINRCPGLTSSSTFHWTWRSETLWEWGDHQVVCYTKTRS